MSRRIILMAVVIIFILIVVPYSTSSRIRSITKDVLSPVISALYQGSAAVRKIAVTAANIKKLPKENDQLSAEVTRLLVENSNLKEIEHENALLKNELNFSSTSTKKKLVGAR